jgi:hypothetical protein
MKLVDRRNSPKKSANRGSSPKGKLSFSIDFKGGERVMRGMEMERNNRGMIT